MSKRILVAGLSVAVLAAFIYSSKGPDSFAECLLDKLPGTVSDVSARASVASCRDNHPEGMSKSSRGLGAGVWFGYQDRLECISVEAKSTRSIHAAKGIDAACQHLYTSKSPDKKQSGPWEKYQN